MHTCLEEDAGRRFRTWPRFTGRPLHRSVRAAQRPGLRRVRAEQGWWVHLRRCAPCGHVGCCDTSPGQHATEHYEETGHAVIRSYEPGEEWFWDFAREVAFLGPDARRPAAPPRRPGRPRPRGTRPGRLGAVRALTPVRWSRRAARPVTRPHKQDADLTRSRDRRQSASSTNDLRVPPVEPTTSESRWSRRAARPVTRPHKQDADLTGSRDRRQGAFLDQRPPLTAGRTHDLRVPLVEEGRQARHETPQAVRRSHRSRDRRQGAFLDQRPPRPAGRTHGLRVPLVEEGRQARHETPQAVRRPHRSRDRRQSAFLDQRPPRPAGRTHDLRVPLVEEGRQARHETR